MSNIRALFDLLKGITYKGVPLISLADFARRHNTTRHNVYRWQSGVREIPTDVLADLCAILRAGGVRFHVDDVLLSAENKADAQAFVATLKKVAKERIAKEKADGKPKPRRQDRGTGNPSAGNAGND